MKQVKLQGYNKVFRFIPAVLVFLCSMYSFGAMAQTPDPGLMGPHSVLKLEYDLGDAAYTAPAGAMFPIPMEVRGSVQYPSDLSSGPFPVVVFLHGRHSTCYETANPSNVTSDWPCNPGYQSIVSYEGYDYLAKTMASNGYIVISISCNAINAEDGMLSDAGMNARGYLVQHHLDLWNTWNTAGGAPFGTTFVGKLNMQNIGTMGHSRGGEGVVYNALLNRSLGSPYGIKAVLTLAPVDFMRKALNGIPLMDVAPYCDGDVSDLEGLHFYDDTRYSDPLDDAPKHTVLFMGANHDFFNTVWTPGSYIAGGADDWADYGYNPLDPYCGTSQPSRFDTTKQKAALNAYLPCFFRIYLGHELKFTPILTVENIIPPASSTLDTNNVYVSYHPGVTRRMDVNREDSTSDVTNNTLHGGVTSGGLVSSGICGGGPCCSGAEPACGISPNPDQEPHKGSGSQKGLSQMSLRWNDTADWYQNAVPAGNEDLTLFTALQFRTTVNFNNSPSGQNLNFTVQLIDSAGNAASQDVHSYSRALFFQKGSEGGELPKAVFNTVKIPVSGFTGIDLTKVRYIKFKFNKSTAGSILISDLAFVMPVCGRMNAAYTFNVNPATHNVTYTNTSTSNASDTVSYYWNFGETSSGTSDTSTLFNPNHTYAAPGTYTSCLYITSRQTNGFVCTDTFCQTIVILSVGINELNENLITIIPNPAKDYLQINGAEKTDVLTLINLYGQVVLNATISEPVIHLPQDLATGIYYAIITTERGKVYKKIVITR